MRACRRLAHAIVCGLSPFALVAATALADEVQGTPRLLGSGLQTQTLVVAEGETQGPVLCPSSTEMRLRHLTDLVFSATGIWQLDKQGEKRCLQVNSFTVLRTVSGHAVAVGQLVETAGHFAIVGDNGTKLNLNDVPDGLKKYRASRVIVDLGAGGTSQQVSELRSVIAYRAYP